MTEWLTPYRSILLACFAVEMGVLVFLGWLLREQLKWKRDA